VIANETFKENLEICLRTFKTHKLRTLLTMLGIIFGVGAVVGMLSIGEGAKREAVKLVQTMGQKHVILKIKDLPDEKLKEVRKFSAGLTDRDAHALAQAVPGARRVVSIREIPVDYVWNERGRSNARALAVNPEYQDVMNFSILRGRFFDKRDAGECRQVCVIGNGIARSIYGQMNPMGTAIKVDNLWYRVVGVVGSRWSSKESLKGLEAEEVDRVVYIPLTTARVKIPLKPDESPLQEIAITLESTQHIETIRDFVERMITRLHGNQADFTLTVPLLLLRQKQETQRIFNIVMGLIAGISLIVGGIGIMNIMLASILERIREIGLRRALGATRRQILVQFLTEAVVISASGGVLGIVLGWGIALAVSVFTDWTTVVAWWSIVLSVGVSAGVGIAFGYYPARHAAQFSPIRALRYE